MRVVLASSNKGKLEELNRLLSGLNLDLVTQSELGVLPCEEPFGTFLENALAKARHASACTGLPALADDSGLIVEELTDWAGIRSARLYKDWLDQQMSEVSAAHAKSPRQVDEWPDFHRRYQAGQISLDHANLLCLVHLLKAKRHATTVENAPPIAARFVAVFAFLRSADDPLPLIGQGQWLGELVLTPRGENGHGYDPIFFDATRGFTAAEMSLEEKNTCSHRARAAQAFCAAFQT